MVRGKKSFAGKPALYSLGCFMPEPSSDPTLLHIERQDSLKMFPSSISKNNSYTP
jgi:hypothetical protein